VRAGEHAERPLARERGQERDGHRVDRRPRGASGDAQHVARAQHADGVSAEVAEGERRAAAEIARCIEARAHGEIGALAGAGDAPSVRTWPAAIGTASQ
jgi:hypothetical protein